MSKLRSRRIQVMKNSFFNIFKTKSTGINEGEKLAGEYLKKTGYKIICRNYKTKMGEIDIIAMDKNVLVFVEVKQRKSAHFGAPREFVGYEKQRKIKNTAKLYILKNKYTGDLRFDVVEVLNGEINHIKNAF